MFQRGYSMYIYVKDFITRIPRIFQLILVILAIIFIAGLVIWVIEPKTFPSLFEGIWWAIVTMSTVGYGDYVPVSKIGKIVGMILILTGAGFVAGYFATLAAAAVKIEENYLMGKSNFTGRNHYIIVGWNERSRNVIRYLTSQSGQMPVVLIDHTLTNHPKTVFPFHFINGKATDDHILHKANIQQATRILITANLTQSEFQSDMFSILTLIASKGLNPHIYSCVEILTEQQVINAKRAGADEIIQTNVFAGEQMVSMLTQNND